jgi:hypothetical protein
MLENTTPLSMVGLSPLSTVVLPDEEEWGFFHTSSTVDAKIVKRLNKMLIDILNKAKQGKLKTWGDLGNAVESQLESIDQDNHCIGLTDSDGYDTAARFFADHCDADIYEYIRFSGYWGSDNVKNLLAAAYSK